MADAGAEYVVMEVSAHALALRKECPIVYEAAVFTNLTRDHLDFFGSMERYGRRQGDALSKGALPSRRPQRGTMPFPGL